VLTPSNLHGYARRRLWENLLKLHPGVCDRKYVSGGAVGCGTI
jgi:hypothetical protein